MDTQDSGSRIGLSNPALTEEAKKIITKSIKDNIQDGGTAWMCYSDTELDELGLPELKELRVNMDDLLTKLEGLKNFNLIKYTGHYALTIDRGMGKPIIIQGDSLQEINDHLRSYLGALS